MTHHDVPSSKATTVAEEDTQTQALAGPISHDISQTYPESSVGLTEIRAMETAYSALEALGEGARSRAFKWLAEALSVDILQQTQHQSARVGPQNYPTATVPDGKQVTPREFISQKKPEALVERVACLAYYLTRYRGISHFKTSDIVALNTEAAAHRFGNPSRDVDNADRHNGYLVSAGNGKKQLTVRGEAVVEALPDREAARSALKEHPHKPPRSSSSKKMTVPTASEH